MRVATGLSIETRASLADGLSPRTRGYGPVARRPAGQAGIRGPWRKRPIASATRLSTCSGRDDAGGDERRDALHRGEEKEADALRIAGLEHAACLAFFDQLEDDQEGAVGGLVQRPGLFAVLAGEHQLEECGVA